MIERHDDMAMLLAYKDKEVIKIITGVRRCGKSTLLKMFKEKLLSQGIAPDRMIHINFESIQYDQLRSFRALYDFIVERINTGERSYLLLDEIQQVEQWQRAV